MALTKYRLGELIVQSDKRNSSEELTLEAVRGISTGKIFIDTKANMKGVNLKTYKIVKEGEFAYVPDTSRRGDKIAISYNRKQGEILVSAIYTAFSVSRKDVILPDYLFMFFNRSEFDRYARFNSWGSAREIFSWDDMCNTEICLPSISIQSKYASVYNALLDRNYNNEACSVLLKGSLLEGMED